LATDVMMPRLSDSMEEGTVLKWLVDVGGEVKRGEPLVEIETDKANMTYEADTDGVLVEVLAQEGDTLPIGQVIARIGEAGEKPSGDGAAPAAEQESSDVSRQPSAEQREPEPEPREPATATTAEAAESAGNGRVKASPVARRMAREMGVELSQLEGTGPGGRIVKADVEAAAKGDGAPQAAPAPEVAPAREEAPAREAAPPEEAPAAPVRPAAPEPVAVGEAGPKGEVRVQELTRLQQTVSRRMAESKATAPDFELQMEIDMTESVALRAKLKEISDPTPSFNDFVIKACAIALRDFPRANGAYRDGKWELYSRINVGVAVAAQDALVVPTIFGADHKSLGEIARDARELATKVRDGTITPPELSGGTFTVSNLGMYGIENFSAVINPPQAAILAVGALKKKPVVDDRGRIVARDMMGVTLICDHRILYGADAAEFLGRVRELLEQPLKFAL
jgi:pyruvate dehydrogenase E2 component (dihydrolipoamide acetyltransferase)